VSDALLAGTPVRVTLVKHERPNVEYDAVVVSDDGNRIVARGPWVGPDAVDLGFVRFEVGDMFTEHYWRDRWYSVKEVHAADLSLKGWYCDVCRPVRVSEGRIVSDDLELDLWVSPDGRTVLRLDEEEFAASGLDQTDPGAAAQARVALGELERLGRNSFREIRSNGTDRRPARADPQRD